MSVNMPQGEKKDHLGTIKAGLDIYNSINSFGDKKKPEEKKPETTAIQRRADKLSATV